ncbi:TPA: hypothetical protein WHQ07_000128 [Neisseria meningitidis]|uniref:hypothetical protein n=1 Tax=Neisseria meningitidis TaxID=487 RepID=UPI000FCBDBD6|nr:hypothetical protein [Neisseria meningitidis]
MAKYFTETGIGVREHFDFFGEFVVSPAARSDDLALAYGLRLEAGEEGLSLAELFDKRSDSQEPVECGRIDIGGFMLTAKEVDGDGNIGSMGLKVPR